MKKKSSKYRIPLKDASIGDIMTVKQFRYSCSIHSLMDDDGFGYAVKRNKMDPNKTIYPSKRRSIPRDATHILWYNK
jgi:hypothetical protein